MTTGKFPQGRCGQCRHWLTEVDDIGACKRYPPTPLPGEPQALPMMGKYDWCGEFQQGLQS